MTKDRRREGRRIRRGIQLAFHVRYAYLEPWSGLFYAVRPIHAVRTFFLVRGGLGHGSVNRGRCVIVNGSEWWAHILDREQGAMVTKLERPRYLPENYKPGWER